MPARFITAGGGTGGGGSTVPTFIIPETVNHGDAPKITNLRISDSYSRDHSKTILLTKLLSEQYNRSDASLIPLMIIKPPESVNHSDQMNLPLVTLSDSIKRTDSATIIVDFLNAGTFTVPAPYTGNVKTAAWATGGEGGAGAATAGGGGAAGGQYAETTAVAVTSGTDTITVKVGAAVASVGATGNDSWISKNGSAPASTTNGCLAKGGAPGAAGSGTTGGAGGTGSTTGGIGNTVFAGGNGAAGGGIGGSGGGGGGGAGTTGAGGNAATTTGGTGKTIGGGNGGAGGGIAGAGGAGLQAGGGGGGGGSTLGAGGGSAAGRARLTLTI